MNRVLAVITAIALMVNFAPGIAAQTRTSKTRATEKNAREMARLAQTPEQYRALADYYRQLHDDYWMKENAEKSEWIWRAPHTFSLYAKYPAPADSARNLYEYYRYKASKMGELSAKYNKMADSAQAGTEK